MCTKHYPSRHAPAVLDLFVHTSAAATAGRAPLLPLTIFRASTGGS